MSTGRVFDQLKGQPHAVGALRSALQRGRVHHAYRFEGPRGVGKETAAFLLAQSLVCIRPQEGEGCGECSACQRAVRLSPEPPEVPLHPDVILLGRGLYPAQTLGRSSPETAGIGIEQVRRIALERAAYPPHEASRLVIVVRAAHELTTSAANALLKTLEEPRPGVHFVLVTDRPRALLDTLRSRTLPLRFGRLSEAVLAELLTQRGAEAKVSALAGGSMERALELAEGQQLERARAFVKAVRQALRAPDLSSAVQVAADHGGDREQTLELLTALAQYFALSARNHVSSGEEPDLARACAEAFREVERAEQAVRGFCPPALALEALLGGLRQTALARRPS